ncbi:sensor histidine kinase [Ottowia testudinis]|uniref:Histidine kinase n=1 Tax=Ottowia testudinis TaxID=2816950 RepID=A0A975CDV0_9BURK|nr:histidine kinase [Ottowia testudinis]QTD43941.1 histidine kinase [Ottowia testudinis]
MPANAVQSRAESYTKRSAWKNHAIGWRSLLRHGLQVALFCALVAVFTTLIWPDSSYSRQLVHSLCIGLSTWLTIETGRLVVNPAHCHPSADGDAGWPKGWRGLALTVFGIGTGFFVGTRFSRWALGEAQEFAQRDLLIGLLVTAAAGTVASFYYHARGKTSALQAEIAAAERDATEARLRLLQSQLEPHMLFNTLANLRALIGVDPPAAQQMVDRMNDYLRATLAASRATQHPLATEFDRVHDYLALMAIRMGPRLAFKLNLPDDLRALPVPPLLLQPLVENAIRHGLEPQVAGGRIEVTAERAGGARLLLTVLDTGAGLPAAVQTAPPPGGFGLTQVRERLRTLYGGRATLDLRAAPAGGTRAEIAIPIE